MQPHLQYAGEVINRNSSILKYHCIRHYTCLLPIKVFILCTTWGMDLPLKWPYANDTKSLWQNTVAFYSQSLSPFHSCCSEQWQIPTITDVSKSCMLWSYNTTVKGSLTIVQMPTLHTHLSSPTYANSMSPIHYHYS